MMHQQIGPCLKLFYDFFVSFLFLFVAIAAGKVGYYGLEKRAATQ